MNLCFQVKPEEKDAYEAFWQVNDYVAGAYDARRDFEMLNQEISKKEKNVAANRLFYLALPPSVFEPVTTNIRTTCMASR
jgi:glucose-6-phosphate 1-dehydrogenase